MAICHISVTKMPQIRTESGQYIKDFVNKTLRIETINNLIFHFLIFPAIVLNLKFQQPFFRIQLRRSAYWQRQQRRCMPKVNIGKHRQIFQCPLVPHNIGQLFGTDFRGLLKPPDNHAFNIAEIFLITQSLQIPLKSRGISAGSKTILNKQDCRLIERRAERCSEQQIKSPQISSDYFTTSRTRLQDFPAFIGNKIPLVLVYKPGIVAPLRGRSCFILPAAHNRLSNVYSAPLSIPRELKCGPEKVTIPVLA